MNFDDFSPENIDLRAIKVEEAFGAQANAFFAQFETEDFTESDVDFFADKKVDWFDEKSDVLGGMTPREYIAENWGEKPDFDAAVTLVKPFFFDDNYDVPKELADLIRSFPEFTVWAADFIDMLIAETDGKNMLSEGSFFLLLSEISDERLIAKSLELFDKKDAKEDEFSCEVIAGFLSTSQAGMDAIAKKASTSLPDEKIFTLLSIASTSEIKSDNFYKSMRSFCKNADESLKPACFYMFADYGDQRAVSFLRAQAKKYRDAWLACENPEESREIYLTVVSIISELGGNTEDFD